MAEITRLFDFPQYQLEHFDLDTAFCTKYGEEWVKTSTREFIRSVDQFSRGLLNMGVTAGDKIALISTTNRTEWHIADMGILQTGAINVPIYPTISEEDYAYILNHSGSSYCIVSDKDLYDKVSSIRDLVPGLKEVYTFDQIEGSRNYREILESGKNESNQKDLEAAREKVQAADLATIIYTSGTTGRPKGVMLSHHNIVSNVLASKERVPLSPGDSALSFLPICHIFERMVTYLYQYCGISIYFAESIEKISDNLKEIRPNVMTVVPRLLEKVYDKIYAKGAELTGIKKRLFFWAIELGKKFEPYNANGAWYEFQLNIARKLIFSKWQEALGGNLKILVSGSAALQPTLARIFGAAGMPVMEGYGLTETSPVIAVADQNNRGWKIGSVGRIIPGVEVKIAEDGEILCKGPNVMMGYYKDPERTAEVMTGEYFHTGDIGEIDKDGFLRITDRKKEMFKTSGGKYVAPQLIENDMKQSRFIEQIMVIGEGEKMPAALIQPNFEFVREWARRHQVQLNGDNNSLVNNEKVINRIQEEIDLYNERFGKWERIKKFELTPDVWSIDEGHLTPTMKLKRKVIKEKYIDLYNRIYDRSL